MSDTFPSWRYGPGGASGIFQTAADVPEGWAEHPSAFAPEEAPAPASGAWQEFFEAAADAFDHDGKDGPGGSPKLDPTEELRQMRDIYKQVVGKKPFNGWDAETLRAKIDAVVMHDASQGAKKAKS